MPAASSQSLRHFIYRSQVISLYRQYIRASRSLGAGQARADLTQEVRRNFDVQRHVTDLQAIKFHLSEGRKRLEQLQDFIMVLDAFSQRKTVVLTGLQAECGDKSRKGSVDAPVVGLVAALNGHPGLYTTSSCSGRISVFGEPTLASRQQGKKGGEWVYASHEKAVTQDVIAAIHGRCVSGDRLVLRFEPFILALEASTPMLGQRVLAAARAAGFRESGLTLGSGGRRVMVGVRCSLRLEVPLADSGAVLVPDAYLTYLVDLANAKFDQNLERIARFEQELAGLLREAAAPSPPPPQPPQPPYAMVVGGGVASQPGPPRSPHPPAADPHPPNGVHSSDGASLKLLAAAPARRRRDGTGDVITLAGGGVSGGGKSQLMALKSRQARLLGRITALELQLGVRAARGSAAASSGSYGAVGRSAGRKPVKSTSPSAGPVAVATQHRHAQPRAVPVECAKVSALEPVRGDGSAKPLQAKIASSRRVEAEAASLVAPVVSSAGSGPLCWQPVPMCIGQGTVEDAIPRWGHASAVHAGRIYLLAGYGGGGAHARRSDVLVYDTERRTWEALELAPTTSAASPPPRMGHTAVSLGGGFILMIAGRTSPSEALADVWILDIQTRSWIQIRPSVDPSTTSGSPCAHSTFPGRYRHSTVAVPPPPAEPTIAPPAQILPLLSNGTQSSGTREEAPSGNSIGDLENSERVRALSGWRVVVFGGRNADAVLGDTWVLSRDPTVSGSGCGDALDAGWRWRQVTQSPAASATAVTTAAAAAAAQMDAVHGPAPRKSHAACYVPAEALLSRTTTHTVGTPAAASSGRMYVHGGTCGYGTHFGDTYYLDLDTYTWHAAAAPPPAAPHSVGGPTAGSNAASAAAGQLPPTSTTVNAPPACFSHTLSRWGPYLLLVGGIPTAYHTTLWVLDVRDHTWTPLPTCVQPPLPPPVQAPPPTTTTQPQEAALAAPTAATTSAAAATATNLDFVPIRHCAEVAVVGGGGGTGTEHGGSDAATAALFVLGGGAFCFSFGTLFGGCFQLLLGPADRGSPSLGGPLEEVLAAQRRRGLQGRSTDPADSADSANPARGTDNVGPAAGPVCVFMNGDMRSQAEEKAGATSAPASAADHVNGDWVVQVPVSFAKAVKDALKAAGWLDPSRRVGTAAATCESSTAVDCGRGGSAVGVSPVAMEEAGTSARGAAGDRYVLLPVKSAALRLVAGGGELAERLRQAGAVLISSRLSPATKAPSTPSQRLRDAVTQLLQSRGCGGATTVTSAPASTCPTNHNASALTGTQTSPSTLSLSTPSSTTAPGLLSELLCDLPTRWERLGDLALLPANCLGHPGWLHVMAGGVGGGDEVLAPLWRVVAEALGVDRLARQAPVANTGTRDSRAVLLLGSHGWVTHREGGVRFSLDVTRCMFSSGNVTERMRMGWGRGLEGAGGAGGPTGRPGWAAGETVVDLYAGIGYYTVPLLVVGGVGKVYACEWNPHAREALAANLQQPPHPATLTPPAPASGPPPALGGHLPVPPPAVAARCEVLAGDCRLTAPADVADRVMLGLLPSSRGGWETALRALKPETGGWLHLHHNVTDREEATWLEETMSELASLAAGLGRDWQLQLRHVERVKWYAPHIRHIVMDIEVRPQGYLPTTASNSTPTPSPTPTPAPALVRTSATYATATSTPTPGSPPLAQQSQHSRAQVPLAADVAAGASHTLKNKTPNAASATAAPAVVMEKAAAEKEGDRPAQPYSPRVQVSSIVNGSRSQESESATTQGLGPGSGSATAGGWQPPRWYEQPLERLPRVRRVCGGVSRQEFESGISAQRQPVILEGLDLGPAPTTWTPDYLMNLPAARSTLVSVHVSREPSGCLDFTHKNFAFRTMSLWELLARITGGPPPPPSTRQTSPGPATGAGAAGVEAEAGAAPATGPAAAAAPPPPASAAVAATSGGALAEEGQHGAGGCGGWPELVPRGPEFGWGQEVLYLRSIGENPRREPANLAASFPSLAPDLVLPPLFPPDALHSSVLRLSSPGLTLWTHYDVMDNLLLQVHSTKRVLLWPPSCHDALHVTGSSSPVIHLASPDLNTYPRYASCPAPLMADLSPGDVLFLPSLWLHNVTATGDQMSISVNAFWRHLPQQYYNRKDLYGNRDLVQAEAADKAGDEALSQLAALPPHYRSFYAARLLGRLARELGLDWLGLAGAAQQEEGGTAQGDAGV